MVVRFTVVALCSSIYNSFYTIGFTHVAILHTQTIAMVTYNLHVVHVSNCKLNYFRFDLHIFAYLLPFIKLCMISLFTEIILHIGQVHASMVLVQFK